MRRCAAARRGARCSLAARAMRAGGVRAFLLARKRVCFPRVAAALGPSWRAPALQRRQAALSACEGR
eukprot:2168733-Alexandrium_andersonii.AAC.1